MLRRTSLLPRPLKTSLARFSSAAAMCAALAMAARSGIKAATISWDGGGGDFKWTTATNWSGDALPSTVGLGDDLIFGVASATPGTVDLQGNQLAASVRFSNTTGYILGLTGTANILTVNSGLITVDSGLTGVINAVVDTTNLSKAGTGILTLNAASVRTGTNQINAGTIIVTNAAALGTGDTTVGTGTTLTSAVNAATQSFAG